MAGVLPFADTVLVEQCAVITVRHLPAGWTFQLTNTRLFLDEPIVIDTAMRASLDEFAGRDPGKMWAWFVFATRLTTEHDFTLLTGGHG